MVDAQETEAMGQTVAFLEVANGYSEMKSGPESNLRPAI
jgi:hypothetical protein